MVFYTKELTPHVEDVTLAVQKTVPNRFTPGMDLA
jgi:hypothetical protein